MRRILALTLCLMTIFAPLAARAASVEDAFLAWLSADAAFVAAEDTQTGQTRTPFAAGGGHRAPQLDAVGQAPLCAARRKRGKRTLQEPPRRKRRLCHRGYR